MATKTAGLPEPGTPEAAQAQPPDDGTMAELAISQWEFIDRVPTREDVVELLATLPPVWGVATVKFADYVQALPQRKKIKVPHESNPNVMVDKHLDCYTLYVSVAGRLKMLEAAAEANGWQVDFVPEEFTPTGVPGYISMEPRLVYREYVVVTSRPPLGGDQEHWDVAVPMGRKPGTAWVPSTGGSNAAGSNPYEKVETSARGRAIAAWGFGVLPGSGVASVEEIQGARTNRLHLDAESAVAQGPASGRTVRVSRDELISRVLTAAEEVRQHKGETPEQSNQHLGTYLQVSLGATRAWDPETQRIDWSQVKDGQLQLAANALSDALAKIVAAEHGL